MPEVSSVARVFLFSLRHMFHKKIRSLYPHPWAKLSACIAVFTPLVSPTVIVSNPGSASFLKAHEKSQAKTTFAFSSIRCSLHYVQRIAHQDNSEPGRAPGCTRHYAIQLNPQYNMRHLFVKKVIKRRNNCFGFLLCLLCNNSSWNTYENVRVPELCSGSVEKI